MVNYDAVKIKSRRSEGALLGIGGVAAAHVQCVIDELTAITGIGRYPVHDDRAVLIGARLIKEIIVNKGVVQPTEKAGSDVGENVVANSQIVHRSVISIVGRIADLDVTIMDIVIFNNVIQT